MSHIFLKNLMIGEIALQFTVFLSTFSLRREYVQRESVSHTTASSRRAASLNLQTKLQAGVRSTNTPAALNKLAVFY